MKRTVNCQICHEEFRAEYGVYVHVCPRCIRTLYRQLEIEKEKENDQSKNSQDGS